MGRKASGLKAIKPKVAGLPKLGVKGTLLKTLLDGCLQKTKLGIQQEVAMKKQILTVICAVIILSLSTGASAMMVGISIDELTNSSDAVTRGVVVDSLSYWSDDGSAIMTKAYLVVVDVVRQKQSSRVTESQRIAIEYEGGEVGDIGFRKSNVAPMKIGEEVIVFIEAVRKETRTAQTGGEKVYKMVGDAQGKYTITKEGKAVKKDFSIASRKDVVVSELPVEELIEKIRRVK